MKKDLFQAANSVYINARSFLLSQHTLADFPPVDHISKIVDSCYQLLDDQDDERASNIRRLLWLFRNTLYLTPLPLNDIRLQLHSQLSSIVEATVPFPEVRERIDDLIKTVTYFDRNPLNPKREGLLGLFAETTNLNSIGVITNVTRGRVPGSDDTDWEELLSLYPSTKAIRNLNELISGNHELIVLPANGRFCGFLKQIYTGYSAARLDVITYASEGVMNPTFSPLISGLRLQSNKTQITEVPVPSDQLADWIDGDYWQSVRASVQNLVGIEIQNTTVFNVSARLCLFESGRAVYLLEDRKYVEISDLVGAGSSFPNRLPRERARNLETGDLILLRTEGSGDYLVDVADNLLGQDGLDGLRAQSTNWKQDLDRYLTTHGPGNIAQHMKEAGIDLRDANYIWFWATDFVMRPQNIGIFKALITALVALTRDEISETVDAYIEKKWYDMGTIVRYHNRAGKYIRRELLAELSKLAIEQAEFGEETRIQLHNVSAGGMTVFRIKSVDQNSTSVPYTVVDRVTEVV